MEKKLIQKHLKYNEKTGDLFWIKSKGSMKKNKKAGSLHRSGYIHVQFENKILLAHRISFLLYHGYLPKFIDHINGIRSDNRIENLRELSKRLNCINTKKHRSGLLAGASYSKRNNRWYSYAKVKGKKKYIGCYKTQQEASSAYFSFIEKIEE